jgi:hypothetical protein
MERHQAITLRSKAQHNLAVYQLFQTNKIKHYLINSEIFTHFYEKLKILAASNRHIKVKPINIDV